MLGRDTSDHDQQCSGQGWFGVPSPFTKWALLCVGRGIADFNFIAANVAQSAAEHPHETKNLR